ncbi:MAG: transposase [Bacteroidetes bacterium]|nr:transposase [Bacteroidota bacterium]
MEFAENNLYHIYNRGNNKQLIFFREENYLYFLTKIRKFISPNCELLAYTLMPNHFHLLAYADNRTTSKIIIGNSERNVLSEGIRNLLHTYTKAINKQNGTSGSLFQQNTKSKCLNNGSLDYATTCFHYIHQNALAAGLIKQMEDWNYSSFKDYAGFRNGTLCNKELAFKLLNLDKPNFYKDSYNMIDSDKIKLLM